MLEEYITTFFWGLTGAITMIVTVPLLLWAFDRFTPINEWEEIKKGNMAVATIIASLIIGFAIVMGLSIIPAV